MLHLEEAILITQGNLANTYQLLRRYDEALRLRQHVYSGRLKLLGEEHEETFRAALNYATSLITLKRFEEAKLLLRKTTPVARRVLRENHDLTLLMRSIYAHALSQDDGATLDDVREALETLADAERIARRVFGSTHPLLVNIEGHLRCARAALCARETSCTCVPVPPPSPLGPA